MKYLIVLALLCTSTGAYAFDCDDIRSLVKALGEKKAIELARKNGASEEQIEIARECLKPRK